MFGSVQIFKLDASRGRQKNSAGCGLAPTAARGAVTNRDVVFRRRVRRRNALILTLIFTLIFTTK